MYSKIVFLLFLNSVFAENSCDCSGVTIEQSEQETNDIVEFLTRVSSKTDATEDERYPAIPAVALTGSLGCQCENLRKKRKITPNEGIPLLDETPQFNKGNCPQGLIRFSPKLCLSPEELEK